MLQRTRKWIKYLEIFYNAQRNRLEGSGLEWRHNQNKLFTNLKDNAITMFGLYQIKKPDYKDYLVLM